MRSGFLGSLWLSFALCLVLEGVLYSQCSPGLHAGIQAQLVPHRNGYTDEARVQLSFVLLNDSDRALDVHADSWKIVVNGAELEDSGYIFGNGPGPIRGYRILDQGDHYELGKALSISTYFHSPGEYKIAWKGAGFESPTITVVIASPKASSGN